MATTIDKGSITAKATPDPQVFQIGFDFTDDAVVVATQGWLNAWKHAEFVYNTNMTNTQFLSAANAAMQAARKPTAETTLENTLKAKYGIAVVRTDPDTTVTPQPVKIVAVESGVLFPEA